MGEPNIVYRKRQAEDGCIILVSNVSAECTSNMIEGQITVCVCVCVCVCTWRRNKLLKCDTVLSVHFIRDSVEISEN